MPKTNPEFEQLVADLQSTYVALDTLRASVSQFAKTQGIKPSYADIKGMSASDLLQFAALIRRIREDAPVKEDPNATNRCV